MLPMIPTSLNKGEWFPYVEGQQIELKENNTLKLDITLCSFLNTAGGYYIVGVKDSGEIVGVDRTTADGYLQRLDYIIRENRILNTTTGDYAGIKELSSSVILLDPKSCVVIIKAQSTNSDHVFQTESGVWYRLNASNMRCRSEFEDARTTRDRLQCKNHEMLMSITNLTKDLRQSIVAYTETLAILHARILAEKEEAERMLVKQKSSFCGLQIPALPFMMM